MNGSKRILYVQQFNGTVREFPILVGDKTDTSISIKLENGTQKTFQDRDLFESLKILRLYFEQQEARVLCNGSRFDVFPSGMSRSMGKGAKAYVMTMGKQARRSDLVDIFGKASQERIGTVEEQEKYHQEWIVSLGR